MAVASISTGAFAFILAGVAGSLNAAAFTPWASFPPT
jgi:hypothetical protein